jgi:hypothetical protein
MEIVGFGINTFAITFYKAIWTFTLAVDTSETE